MKTTSEQWLDAARWTAIGSAAAAMVSVAVSQSLLGIALACLLLSRKAWKSPPGAAWLCLFVGWTFLSLLVNGDPAAGLPQIRKLYVWLLLFVLLTALRGADDFRLLIHMWLVLATAAAIQGLRQFWMKWQAASAAGVDFYQDYVGQRITGFMSHWMTFSSQMLVALLCCGAIVLFAPMERGRRIRIAGVCLPLLSAALVLGFTRGIWLAAAAGAVYLAWNWRRWAVLVIPAAAALVLIAGPASVRTRVNSLVQPRGERDSNQHRVVTWRTGLEMIKARPLVGLGPEQVGKRFESYVPRDVRRPLPEGWYGHLHNIYLQYAAERGIPAVVFLMLFLLAQARDWLRRFHTGLMPGWAFHAAMAVLIGILVTGLFEHNLGDSEVLALFLGTIGCAARAGQPGPADGSA